MPNEERTGLSEGEQRPECAPSTSSDPTHSEAVDSKGTFVIGTISGSQTPNNERAVAVINDQGPECPPSTLPRQGPEEATEFKEAPLTNSANETTTRGQNGLSDEAPSATPPLEGQKKPTANKELGGGNTPSETAVEAAEEVRGPAVLEGSEIPNRPAVRNTHSAGQETTSQKLSERERNARESALRTTVISTGLQQKALGTQDILDSASSKIKDSKNHAQVSNITCISCNSRLFGVIKFRAC